MDLLQTDAGVQVRCAAEVREEKRHVEEKMGRTEDLPNHQLLCSGQPCSPAFITYGHRYAQINTCTTNVPHLGSVNLAEPHAWSWSAR